MSKTKDSKQAEAALSAKFGTAFKKELRDVCSDAIAEFYDEFVNIAKPDMKIELWDTAKGECRIDVSDEFYSDPDGLGLWLTLPLGDAVDNYIKDSFNVDDPELPRKTRFENMAKYFEAQAAKLRVAANHLPTSKQDSP